MLGYYHLQHVELPETIHIKMDESVRVGISIKSDICKQETVVKTLATAKSKTAMHLKQSPQKPINGRCKSTSRTKPASHAASAKTPRSRSSSKSR